MPKTLRSFSFPKTFGLKLAWFSPPSSPATFGRQVSREIKPDVEIKEEEDEEELEEVAGRVKPQKTWSTNKTNLPWLFFLGDFWSSNVYVEFGLISVES